MNIVSSDLTSNTLTFKVNSVDAIKVATNGNVGIGTTTPSTTLDVSGAVKFRGALDMTNQNISGVGSLTVSGNVGIGTSAPSYKHHIYGSLTNGVVSTVENASSDSSSYAQLMLKTDQTNVFSIFKNSTTRTLDGGVNTTTIRNDGGKLRLQNNAGDNDGIIISGANVGIGTSTPSFTLDVSGSAIIRNLMYQQFGTDNFIQPLTIAGTFNTTSPFVIPLLLHSTSGFNLVEVKISFYHTHSDRVSFYIVGLLNEASSNTSTESCAWVYHFPNNAVTYVGVDSYFAFGAASNTPLHATMLFSKTPNNTLITYSGSSSCYWNAGGSSGMLLTRYSGLVRTAEGHRLYINSNAGVGISVVGRYSVTAYT